MEQGRDMEIVSVNTTTKKKNTSKKPVKIKCKVISYNSHSGEMVYEKKGHLYQTNQIKNYDGKGYVEV